MTGFAGAVTLVGLKAALDAKLTAGEVKLDRRFEIGAIQYISERMALGNQTCGVLTTRGKRSRQHWLSGLAFKGLLEGG